MARVLLAGESWFRYSVEIKGFDNYTRGGYEIGTQFLAAALEGAGHEFIHLPSHLVDGGWPDDLSGFDVVLLSDIGTNTLLLTGATFDAGEPRPNPLTSIAEYVRRGGGFGMIGGYLSFAGFEGKAKYNGTVIEEILPVSVSPFDDRVEVPEGIDPVVKLDGHQALGNAQVLGPLLGYNRLCARKEADVVASCGDDPLLITWAVGDGRSFAYASDCGPHWASPGYLRSTDYSRLWNGIIAWAGSAGR